MANLGERALGVTPGEVIGGRYEIVRVIGVGGTGAVFEARHRAIGRTVAVKVLLPELVSNPSVPARFLQEARAANEVHHKNIVEVIDFGDDRGRLFMVMEYLQGESLSAKIKRDAPLAPADVIALLDPVMSALAASHDQGIIHRDVKPQNIFLAETQGDEEPQPKLIDFGIAKRIFADDVKLTATGMILGTPAYMAPEQARGAGDVSTAADQYAIGAILFEALTGRVPHQADTYPAMLVAIVTQPPTDITALRPDLDIGLARVVMKSLSYDPNERFASMAHFREALHPYRRIRSRGVAGESMEPVTAVMRTRPDGTPQPPPPSAVPPPIAPAYVVQHQYPSIPAASVPPQNPVLRAVALGVGLAALVMVALAVGLSVRRETPRVIPVATPREVVTFRIDVEPPTAEIHLDGVPVGRGHAEVVRARDGRRYQLQLAAQGYANVSDVLVAAGDARVSRVLVPLGGRAPSTEPQPPLVVANPPHTHTAPQPPAPSTPTPVVVADPPRPVVPLVPAVPSGPFRDPSTNPRRPHIDRNNPFQ